jgi:hypothetical protein
MNWLFCKVNAHIRREVDTSKDAARGDGGSRETFHEIRPILMNPATKLTRSLS